VVLGLIGSWFAGRALEGLLFEMSGFNIGLIACVGFALACVSLIACLLPAMRAARVSPMIALRTE